MNSKDRLRHFAHEALTLFLALALLTFICRLWPILLLIILGIFVALIRLLFLSAKQPEQEQPVCVRPVTPVAPTMKNVIDLAYGVIVRRVTELVQRDYPEAKWKWESPQAKRHIEEGDDVFIILNRAGGYQRARVCIHNLKVLGLDFQTAPIPDPVADDRRDTSGAEETDTEPPQENYSLLAFEWAEANIVALNTRCNEAIGQGRTEILLEANELPVRESWEDVCEQLKREGLSDVEITSEGIKIHLMK